MLYIPGSDVRSSHSARASYSCPIASSARAAFIPRDPYHLFWSVLAVSFVPGWMLLCSTGVTELRLYAQLGAILADEGSAICPPSATPIEHYSWHIQPPFLWLTAGVLALRSFSSRSLSFLVSPSSTLLSWLTVGCLSLDPLQSSGRYGGEMMTAS